MTIDKDKIIGLDRSLRLEWLDAISSLIVAGNPRETVRDRMAVLLDSDDARILGSTAKRKSITVLSRVWLTPPPAAVSLRDNALLLLSQVSADERIAIHWAMLSAVYPFFCDVTRLVGSNLDINGEISLSQLTRRLVVSWGDRSTLRRATQRLMRSLVQWGMLNDSGKPGVYLRSNKRIAVSQKVMEILLEGLLISNNCSMSLLQLEKHPSNFPFVIKLNIRELRRNTRIRIHHQGDHSDMIEIA